jgi:hypothetical protein
MSAANPSSGSVLNFPNPLRLFSGKYLLTSLPIGAIDRANAQKVFGYKRAPKTKLHLPPLEKRENYEELQKSPFVKGELRGICRL